MSVVAALRCDDPPGRGAPGRRRVPRAEREPQMVSAAMRVFADLLTDMQEALETSTDWD